MEYTELKPINGRKSFYGKARVETTSEEITLINYSTKVASYKNAVLKIHNSHMISATTANHIRAFLAYLGLPDCMTIKQMKEL